uniref:Transposase n=2 Tax=Candidatus Kentrum sp. DK TaxID=2126562 RepID=A0A450TPU4_9GAMM|nr:MAG: Transposase [Candidatus Kentron sp. DK]
MTDTIKKHLSSTQITESPTGTREAGRTSPPLPTDSQEQPSRPNTEVLEKAVRRRFTADYKRRILSEADACTEPGGIGKLLRREGLYSSNLTNWRSQRNQGIRDGLSRSRGRKPQEKNLLADENTRLQKEIQRLHKRLMQAQTIIDVQKKLSQLLGMNDSPVYDGRPS